MSERNDTAFVEVKIEPGLLNIKTEYEENANVTDVQIKVETPEDCDETIEYKAIIIKQECKVCGSPYSGYLSLVQHAQEEHYTEELYFCEICEQMYTNTDNLCSHIEVHKTNEEVNFEKLRPTDIDKLYFKCSICPKRLRSAFVLRRHMESHSKEERISCNVCKEIIVDDQERKAHTESHFCKGRLKCLYCDRLCSTVSTLRRHISIHKRDMRCNICEISYNRPHHLQSHMKHMHAASIFKCDCCDKFFANKRALQTHVQKKASQKSSEIKSENIEDGGDVLK